MSFPRSPHAPMSPRRDVCLLAALLVMAWPAVSPAQTTAVSTIAAFSGSRASSGPVLGPDGALYGTTSASTSVTGGLLYRLEANGSAIRTIYQFKVTDGFSPVGGLLLGSDGLLYGTTSTGDGTQFNTPGTVYRVAPDGSGFTILHRFETFGATSPIGTPVNTDGANPETELVEGGDGYLYGVTRAGGPDGTGVVFKIARDGNDFAVLHAFGPITSAAIGTVPTNEDGYAPTGPLLAGADGYFYGTTSQGGVTGSGTIFRVSFDGSDFATVYTFPATTADASGVVVNTEGANPVAGLTDGQDARLYGTTNLGGATGNGTLFAFDPVSRLLSVLHPFDALQGARPTGELLLAQDGKLYGTAATGGTNAAGDVTTYGTVFSIARDGTGFTTLHNFAGTDGATPTGRLLQLSGTAFVGVAQGGAKCNQGSIYQLSLDGAEVKGITNCGQKKNSGGGGVESLLLLMLGSLGLLRALRGR
jgi:uncharacterized repeat protein (TIGR03803 family)